MKTQNEKQFQLPKEFAENWIKDLKNGKFKQTRNKLFDSNCNGYCCLGVALTPYFTEEQIKEGARNTENGIPIHIIDWYEENNNVTIPSDFPEALIDVSDYNLGYILTSLNDGFDVARYNNLIKKKINFPFKVNFTDCEDDLFCCNFNQIADFIEANVEFV